MSPHHAQLGATSPWQRVLRASTNPQNTTEGIALNQSANSSLALNLRTAVVSATLLAVCGCTVIGPRSISGGRGAYAEVINRTEDEQILNVIVRARYNETFGMMTVAAVTANLRFSVNASADFGFGGIDNYENNLVPLSTGIGYEENPTISYVPLSGEDFTRRMLTPVTIDEWLLLGSQAPRPGHVLDLAVHRINGLRNSMGAGKAAQPDFQRLIELYNELRLAGVLDTVLGNNPENTEELFWDFHDYGDDYVGKVREFLDLLGLEADVTGADILIPLRQAIGRSSSLINIQTRSAVDVLAAFGRGVEIPPDHLEAGIVEALPPADTRTRFVTIRSSKNRPKDATVSVLFRDRWFYIDATDADSKRAFIFLRTLIGIRLADPAGEQRAPVITVPVG